MSPLWAWSGLALGHKEVVHISGFTAKQIRDKDLQSQRFRDKELLPTRVSCARMSSIDSHVVVVLFLGLLKLAWSAVPLCGVDGVGSCVVLCFHVLGICWLM